MTGSSSRGMSSRNGRPGRGVAAAARASVGRLWHAVASLAEMLSDAGHGPRRWRERSEMPNPYAGAGPIPPDERDPEDL